MDQYQKMMLNIILLSSAKNKCYVEVTGKNNELLEVVIINPKKYFSIYHTVKKNKTEDDSILGYRL